MRRSHGAELPVRPHIPATMGAAAGALLASAVMLQATWSAYARSGRASVCLPLAAALVGAGALALAAAHRLGGSPRCGQVASWSRWLGAGVLLATAASISWAVSWQGRHEAVAHARIGACAFEVRGDPGIGSFGASMTARIVDSDSIPLGEVRLTADEPRERGETLRLVARVKEFDGGDWARSRFMKGEVASVQAVRVLDIDRSGTLDPIGAARARALAAIEPSRSDARALIAGVVCGRTTELNEVPASEDFASAGLTHLVAVSGSHLAFITMLLEGALGRLRLRRSARASILLSIMGAYVVFTGCAASAVRSVLMVAGALLCGMGGRRSHPLSALAITVTALVLIDPGVAFDLGFQLSAASVLFILVFGRYVAYLFAVAGAPAAVAEALSLTLCSQWATLPLTAPVFGRLSLIAPVANLVVGPVMSALLVIGLIAVPVCSIAPVLGPLLAVPESLASFSIFLSALFADIPFAAVPVSLSWVQLAPCHLVALPVYLVWRDWGRWQVIAAAAAAAIAVSVHLARWTLFAPAGLIVLDVGQADAILVRDGASSLLVDAGVDDGVVAALARNHVYRLDAVAVTHWDRDHWGGLPDLLQSVSVGRLIVPEGAARAMPAEVRSAFRGEVVELEAGDGLGVGRFSCEVVWPRTPVTGEENADSLCLAVSYEDGDGSLSALLTGDTEQDELESYAPEVGDIDLLKVGHHGSKVSVSPEATDALDPEVAVASAGEGNSYGHPSDECVEILEAAGAKFLCTIDYGDVTVSPGPDGPVLRASRRASSAPASTT